MQVGFGLISLLFSFPFPVQIMVGGKYWPQVEILFQNATQNETLENHYKQKFCKSKYRFETALQNEMSPNMSTMLRQKKRLAFRGPPSLPSWRRSLCWAKVSVHLRKTQQLGLKLKVSPKVRPIGRGLLQLVPSWRGRSSPSLWLAWKAQNVSIHNELWGRETWIVACCWMRLQMVAG